VTASGEHAAALARRALRARYRAVRATATRFFGATAARAARARLLFVVFSAVLLPWYSAVPAGEVTLGCWRRLEGCSGGGDGYGNTGGDGAVVLCACLPHFR